MYALTRRWVPGEEGAAQSLATEGALGGWSGYETHEKAQAEARKELGLTPGAMGESLNRATQNLFEAAGTLKKAATRTADANAHVETPETFGDW